MTDLLLGSSASIFFAALFLGCMIAAAAYDLASYTIPNFLSVLLVAGFVALSVWQNLAWGQLGDHVSAGMVLLASGWALFALGIVGGGDAKFMAATGVWIGWSAMPHYMLAFSLSGGVLVLLLLLFRRLPLPGPILGFAWIADLHNPANGVPYGVALAAGGVAIAPRLAILASY